MTLLLDERICDLGMETGKGEERCGTGRQADRSVQGADLAIGFLFTYSLKYVVSAETLLFLPTHVLREEREQPGMCIQHSSG